MVKKERVIKAIFNAVDEVNQQVPKERQLEKSTKTMLYSEENALDSLMFVTFIVAVEQKIEEEFGVAIMLTDANLMTQKSSHFANIEKFTDYILLLLEKESYE